MGSVVVLKAVQPSGFLGFVYVFNLIDNAHKS